MEKYTPELGQAVFGQPYKTYKASELLEAALSSIDSELRRVMWNINQKEYESPFSNTANSFVSDTFEAHAYDWNDEHNQPYNFKWKDIEISWYKYMGRGMSINKQITNDEIELLLDNCLAAIRSYEKENRNY
jgi:hypothetical protein